MSENNNQNSNNQNSEDLSEDPILRKLQEEYFQQQKAEFLTKMTKPTGLTSTDDYDTDPQGRPLRVTDPALAAQAAQSVPCAAVQDVGVQVEGNAVLVPQMAAETVTPGAEGREELIGMPVWSKPLVKISSPDGVPIELFRRVLTAGYQEYMVAGTVTPDGVKSYLGGRITSERVAKILATPEMRAALMTRGVVTEPVGITPEMDFALMILTDPHDGLTFQKKLRKAKVTSTKYQAWLKNPVFKRQIDMLSEQLAANNHEALIQLAGLVGKGDLNAIKYQLELNGRYNPARENQMDMLVFMNKVLEIIATNVQDPSVLRAIGNDMRQLEAEAAGRPAARLIEGAI